jgi:hypothetical protein
VTLPDLRPIARLCVIALAGIAAATVVLACASSDDAPEASLSHLSAAPSAGRLISEPFKATGVVRVTGEFASPSAEDPHAGVGGFIVPPERAHEGTEALLGERGFVVSPSLPSDTLRDLEGTFVVVVDVPGSTQWSLSVQAAQ